MEPVSQQIPNFLVHLIGKYKPLPHSCSTIGLLKHSYIARLRTGTSVIMITFRLKVSGCTRQVATSGIGIHVQLDMRNY